MPSRDRVVDAVAVVVALSLFLRLVDLGGRPFHWDEARMGYWTLRYAETGIFEYRPVAGGPLLYVVGRWTIGLLGASDAVARLPVAVVGGLLPAVALLFRDVLDDLEATLLAVGLAVAPPLVYYSRFLRGDLLVAAFGLAALGCLVRVHATGNRRRIPAAAVFLALAVATSGFGVVLLLTWLGAAILVLDHRRVADASPARTREYPAAGVAWARARSPTLARAALAALAVHVLAFAPRGFETASLSAPTTWPSVVSVATVGAVRSFWGVRVMDRQYHGTELLPPLLDHGSLLVETALPILVLGVGGFLLDRYDTEGPRPVVAFCGFWAGLGLFLVPVASEVSAPWLLVHTVTPMLVPAAVGGAAFLRWSRRTYRDGDGAGVATAALVIVAVAAHGGIVLSAEVYAGPGNDLAQFGQPGDDLDPVAGAIEGAAGGPETDVLWVGDRFNVVDEGDLDHPPISPSTRTAFGARLPLAWYVERAGATSDSVRSVADLPADPPPVVIAEPSDARALEEELPGYERSEVRTGLWDRRLVVFVETERM